MKRTIALIIAAIMVIMAAGTVFAAPENAEGDIPAMDLTADSTGESEGDSTGDSDSGDLESTFNELLGGLLGGWFVYDELTEYPIPENVKAAFDKAMEGYVGMNFIPMAFLGSQVVAGTNYQILCLGAPVVAEPEMGLYVLIIYEDLQGNTRITKVEDISLADLEDAEDLLEGDDDDDDLDETIAGMMVGGWSVPEEVETMLTEEAAAVFTAATEKLLGVDYTPVAVLGAKVISGVEYAFLVHAKTVTPDAVPYFAVMFIAVNADETYSILKIEPLDLADFNDQEIDD